MQVSIGTTRGQIVRIHKGSKIIVTVVFYDATAGTRVVLVVNKDLTVRPYRFNIHRRILGYLYRLLVLGVVGVIGVIQIEADDVGRGIKVG